MGVRKNLFVLLTTVTTMQTCMQSNPDTNQLEMFRERIQEPVGILTTSSGAPIPLSEATNSLNTRLIFNRYFMESISHVVRERLPERVVHAKGAGAFGYFMVTHNISAICRAKLFSEDGKKTPVVVRFSLIANERGGSDISRDARGFSVRFYTEQGNFDLIGLNTPIFVLKDPIIFSAFARCMKRNPRTNLHDPNMMWDYLTLHPESFHLFFYVFGDLGIPDGYRHMPGFGIHTYQVVNKKGQNYFIRFHFMPDSGIKTLSSNAAQKIERVDFDYNARDLYRSIANGNFPSWTVSIQVLTQEDVEKFGFSLFDVTRTLSMDTFPLRPIGKLVLSRNPLNYFAEIEQLAVCPSNLVDGIVGAPDTLYQSRVMGYRISQGYRLGINYNRINVNCPYNIRTLTYNRDGRPPLGDNEKDIPNYFPNTFNGPVPYIDEDGSPLIKIVEEKPDNFDQTREVYLKMTNEERRRFIDNVLSSLKFAVEFIQQRAIRIFTIIHPDLGDQIRRGLFENETNFYLN